MTIEKIHFIKIKNFEFKEKYIRMSSNNHLTKPGNPTQKVYGSKGVVRKFIYFKTKHYYFPSETEDKDIYYE